MKTTVLRIFLEASRRLHVVTKRIQRLKLNRIKKMYVIRHYKTDNVVRRL